LKGPALLTGAQYDGLGRLKQVFAIPGRTDTLTQWDYDAAGRVVGENGVGFLLDAGGLRFRRTRIDGSRQYTIYGFNAEPLVQFERPALVTVSFLPTPKDFGDAVITAPTSNVTCYTGDVITFAGYTTTPGGTALWKFGDTATANGFNVSHAWTAAGTYQVTLTVQAAGYYDGVASVTVNVLPKNVAVSINPGTLSLAPGGSGSLTATVMGTSNTHVRWTCSGGSLSSSGANPVTYTAPSTGTYTVTATSLDDSTKSATATIYVIVVSISPTTASIQTGLTQAFTATVVGNSNTAVTWSVVEAGGGSVDVSGLYTAPGSAGTYHVMATSVVDSTRSAQATVTASSSPVVVVSVSPTTASIQLSQTQAFTATVTGSSNTAVTWSVVEPGGGSVDASGLYTAPGTVGIYHVKATSLADGTKSAQATVTVSSSPVVVVSVSPVTVSLQTGQTQAFTATVTGSSNTAVTWSVVEPGGGSVNASGFYTPPGSAGTYHVKAKSVADPTKSAQATVTFTVASGIQITVPSAFINLLPGASTSLSATVTGTTNTAVNWVASGGTLSSATTNPTTYTAPITQGTYTVTVKSTADSTKTATVTVNVQNVPLPVVSNFQALPTIIGRGGSATLTWAVANVASVTITGVPGTQAASGSLAVSPGTTTVYKLTASNAAGSVSAEAKVTVLGDLAWTRTMVYAFGGILSEEKPSGTFYILADHVGSPNYVLDSTGKMVGRSKNLPFGERFGSIGEKSIRRFTNHEDQDGSAIYMQARMYLPAYGKFAQPDPAYDQVKEDPESYNLYNYVTNNPVTHTDPDGRSAANDRQRDWNTDFENAFGDAFMFEGGVLIGKSNPIEYLSPISVRTNPTDLIQASDLEKHLIVDKALNASTILTSLMEAAKADSRTNNALKAIIDNNITLSFTGESTLSNGTAAQVAFNSDKNLNLGKINTLSTTKDGSYQPQGYEIIGVIPVQVLTDVARTGSRFGSGFRQLSLIMDLAHEIGGHASQWLFEYSKMENLVGSSGRLAEHQKAYEGPAYKISFAVWDRLSSKYGVNQPLLFKDPNITRSWADSQPWELP
jgi:RHS repeat-associated protein